MTRRKLFLILCAGWIALALMRIVANIAGAMLMEVTWQTLLRIGFGVALIWIPVSALILWVDRSRLASRTIKLAATHVSIASVVAVIEPLWVVIVLGSLGMKSEFLGTMIARIDINFLLYAVVVGADVSWMRLQALKSRELAAARLEQALVDVQLHGLAIQL